MSQSRNSFYKSHLLVKKTLLIIILIITNLFYIFAGGETRFDGMIVLTAKGEKYIAGDDYGISRLVLVYGDCEIYFNNKKRPVKLWELPIGVNVIYNGGISCGLFAEDGSEMCRPTTGHKNEVHIKSKVINVNRKGYKSYTAGILVNDLIRNIYPHIDINLKETFKNTIVNFMDINPSLELKQNEKIVIPVIGNGFLGSNYSIRSEIVFPSLNKIVRIIAGQDMPPENKFAESAYKKFVVINYKNGFSVTKTIELPKDIVDSGYGMPLYYDGAEAGFVIIAAAKWFFIYDLLTGKLSEKIVPQFKKVEYADSQSGNLIFTGISSDGKIVSGKAQDFGPFEFDLSIPYKPTTITSTEEKFETVCEPYTPGKGTDERKAILDALREWVYRTHKLKVIFVVPYLKVFNGWAWVHTRPQSPDGISNYEDISGLIHKTNGKWEVIDIYSRVGNCPDCDDSKHYFENLMKRFPEIPSCILPVNR